MYSEMCNRLFLQSASA